MDVERIYRRTERSVRELARLRAIREEFQREKPSLEELLATGEYDGPVPQGAYLELRQLMHTLRTERERLGLSLADVAKRTGIDKAALSRLETGKQINPTVDTLWRYACAVGKHLAWAVHADETATNAPGKPTAGTKGRSSNQQPARPKTPTNKHPTRSAHGPKKK